MDALLAIRKEQSEAKLQTDQLLEKVNLLEVEVQNVKILVFEEKQSDEGEDLVRELHNVNRKVDDFHPALISIVKAQNEVQRLQKEMHALATKYDAKITQKEKEEKERKVREEEEKERKRKEKEKEFLNSLSGDFSWMKAKISIVNEEIHTTEGKTFTVKEWKSAIEKDTPWALFPEEYEVECYRCKKQNPVSSLNDDNVSVKCPTCNYSTLLDVSKPGFEWNRFSPCKHFHQGPKGERPNNCPVCGIEGSCISSFWSDINDRVRIPTKREEIEEE